MEKQSELLIEEILSSNDGILREQLCILLNRRRGKQFILDEASRIKIPHETIYRGSFSLLFYNGFLNSIDGIWNFTNANLETELVFRDSVLSWTKMQGVTGKDLKSLVDYLIDFDVAKFSGKLGDIIFNQADAEKLPIFYNALMRSVAFSFGPDFRVNFESVGNVSGSCNNNSSNGTNNDETILKISSTISSDRIIIVFETTTDCRYFKEQQSEDLKYVIRNLLKRDKETANFDDDGDGRTLAVSLIFYERLVKSTHRILTITDIFG